MKPREYNPRATLISALVVGGLIVWSYFMRAPEIPLLEIQGETMGTYYIVKVNESGLTQEEAGALKKRIDARLDAVNAQMSTWDSSSEISLFNTEKANSPVKISADFSAVMQEALAIAKLTAGAFDPTVQPLLKLWGFGSEGDPASQKPKPALLAQIKEITGYQHLTLDGSALSKTQDGLQLDLGAIAKGFAVDQLSELLTADGHADTFVDIGGEVRCSGVNPAGIAWRIGIQQPAVGSEYGEMNNLQSVISIDNRAVATSGNYRSYREREDGSRYGHLLDPRIAQPVESHVASVTVIAKSCMRADGLATGLFVMGPEEGLKLIETLEEVEALFLLWNESGELEAMASQQFAKYFATK